MTNKAVLDDETINRSPWAEKKPYDQMHSICSYLGSFPPGLAKYFIQYFTDKGQTILDPFSGRGTTILESRLNERRSFGSDLNPIAVILSKAKSFKINKQKVLKRLKDLEIGYDKNLYYPVADSVDEKIKLIFHKSTISELCYLKHQLNPMKSNVDCFISAVTLGILHGGERKDGTSLYLSISMPNTFSMSPDYVRKYVQKNNLNREYRNTFKSIESKLKTILFKHISPKTEAKVFLCDAKSMSSNNSVSRLKNQIDLVLTSPPYLGIVNYEKQNWIRAWFAEGLNNSSGSEVVLDDNLNLNQWLDFSKKVVIETKAMLKKDGVSVFVIGDVKKSEDTIIPLARDFANMVSQNKFFKNIWVYSDYFDKVNKTTKIWGDTKGRATAIDRIVIMSDTNPFKNNQRLAGAQKISFKEIVSSTKSFMGKTFNT